VQMLDHSVMKKLLPQPLPALRFVVFQVYWQRGEEMLLLLSLPPLPRLADLVLRCEKVCVLQRAR